MVSLNRVLLIGNLTKDPELRYTPSGTPVANLRLAVNSSFKDQAGQRKEETCFVTIVVWSRQAEICQQYLKKGRSVFIEGRLIYRSWESEGKTRSTMEVRADRVQFLGGPGGPARSASQSEAAGTQTGEPVPVEAPAAARTEDAESEAAADESSDADVPF
ncbi:MAG: single-stranded DNA-binding protein [Candidatus Omnitrophica bacterium]|nr:single-stranded DNA-binding protein [Candidatus Omnitrophota bacterium]